MAVRETARVSFDVTILQGLHKSLNQPPQLDGWKLNGGDRCGESWKGISCSGSSYAVTVLLAFGRPLTDFFPTDTIPTDQNVENFPKAQSNAIENYPSPREGKQKPKRWTPEAISQPAQAA